MEGIILDPVYTGKGIYGLYNELKKGRFKECKKILFIHTGGLYGSFPNPIFSIFRRVFSPFFYKDIIKKLKIL